jgi:hypothetical protein
MQEISDDDEDPKLSVSALRSSIPDIPAAQIFLNLPGEKEVEG